MTTPAIEQPTPPGPGEAGDFDIPDWAKGAGAWVATGIVQAATDLWELQSIATDAVGSGFTASWEGEAINDAGAGIANVLANVLKLTQNEIQEDITGKMVERVEEMANNGELSFLLGKFAAQALLVRLTGLSKATKAAKPAAAVGPAAEAAGKVDPTEHVDRLAELCREQGFTGMLEQWCVDALESLEGDDQDALAETIIDPEDVDAAAEHLRLAMLESSNIIFGRRYWRLKYAGNRPERESSTPEATEGDAGGEPAGTGD